MTIWNVDFAVYVKPQMLDRMSRTSQCTSFLDPLQLISLQERTKYMREWETTWRELLVNARQALVRTCAVYQPGTNCGYCADLCAPCHLPCALRLIYRRGLLIVPRHETATTAPPFFVSQKIQTTSLTFCNEPQNSSFVTKNRTTCLVFIFKLTIISDKFVNKQDSFIDRAERGLYFDLCVPHIVAFLSDTCPKFQIHSRNLSEMVEWKWVADGYPTLSILYRALEWNFESCINNNKCW